MSAAEKLKALDGKFELLRVGELPPATIELTFWPQIVAVVEAAEAFRIDQHAMLRESDTPWLRISRALAALDEALS